MRLVDQKGRPILDQALQAIAGELAEASPDELGHIQPEFLLFVAAAARLESRASIRPLRDHSGEASKPEISIAGVEMLYEISLRPRFFRASSPEARLWILAHELWHAAPCFDGTLAPERRHGYVSTAEIDRAILGLVSAHQTLFSTAAAGPLHHVGEVRLSAWLARPPTQIPPGMHGRKYYDESDLYSAVIEQL